MRTTRARNRAEWRQWLTANHDRQGSGQERVDYEASEEAALCFAWVDSLIKKLDDERYARKFTPGRDDRVWSASNRRRADKLPGQGLVTDPGLRKIEAARRSGNWDRPVRRPALTLKMPSRVAAARRANSRARHEFGDLPPSERRRYSVWIETARRETTRATRVSQAVRLLEQGKKLG